MFGLISSSQSQKIKENLFGSEIENKRLHGVCPLSLVRYAAYLIDFATKTVIIMLDFFNFLYYENSEYVNDKDIRSEKGPMCICNFFQTLV